MFFLVVPFIVISEGIEKSKPPIRKTRVFSLSCGTNVACVYLRERVRTSKRTISVLLRTDSITDLTE